MNAIAYLNISQDMSKFWNNVISALSMSENMENISAVVTEAARQISGADGVTFILRDGDLCYYFDENAISPLWKGHKFPIETCISGWVMLNKKHTVIEDIYTDSRVPINSYKPTFVKSLCMIPVREQDPIAAIGSYWKDSYTPTPNQIESLQVLANLTATSIQKIQLRDQLSVELTQTDQLEERNRELELYIQAMAHDLKNPLSILNLIHGQMEQILQAGGKTLASVKVAHATVDRMSKQINRILALCKVKTGQLDRVEVDMGPIFNNLCNTLSLQYKSVATQANTHGNLIALADPTLIYIVLENLISNSFKYYRKDVTRKVYLKAIDESKKERVFSIEDNGIGFENSKTEELFKPFARLHDSSQYSGSGIGLASAAKIISMHGGRIWAESNPSIGSKFFFTLPINP